MKCERIRELIPDYISGMLDSKTRLQIDSHISECVGCKKEIEKVNLVWSKLEQIPAEEPGPAIRNRFYSMLEAYRQALDYTQENLSRSGRLNKCLGNLLPRRPVFQLGMSVVLLIFGIVIGQQMSSNIHKNGEMTQLEEEVHEMRKMVTNSLLNQSSAIERLQGLTMSRQVRDPDELFLSLLLLTLNSDTNVNVRLAAVDAIKMYSDNPWVRNELVKSLSFQTSPLVQISLIELLAKIREQKALYVLRTLINDQKSIEAVKNRARWGIQQII